MSTDIKIAVQDFMDQMAQDLGVNYRQLRYKGLGVVTPNPWIHPMGNKEHVPLDHDMSKKEYVRQWDVRVPVRTMQAMLLDTLTSEVARLDAELAGGSITQPEYDAQLAQAQADFDYESIFQVYVPGYSVAVWEITEDGMEWIPVGIAKDPVLLSERIHFCFAEFGIDQTLS